MPSITAAPPSAPGPCCLRRLRRLERHRGRRKRDQRDGEAAELRLGRREEGPAIEEVELTPRAEQQRNDEGEGGDDARLGTGVHVRRLGRGAGSARRHALRVDPGPAFFVPRERV